jgi:hypothetical protein
MGLEVFLQQVAEFAERFFGSELRAKGDGAAIAECDYVSVVPF